MIHCNQTIKNLHLQYHKKVTLSSSAGNTGTVDTAIINTEGRNVGGSAYSGAKDVVHQSTRPKHFTLSKFGKPVLTLGGYRYNMQNSKNVNQHTTRWRCCKWVSFHCRATIITVDKHIVKVVNRHNHPPEGFDYLNSAKNSSTCAM
ncbi:Uncharacterized protein OBRU01_10461 [Operophtera brumata]|uniref:FLYWCH-type domain-containing protein n=1 Tax=Operophtera brumata TaxID=104452 RepID=A0A0L7LD87_OPEBR|nr:Uncharacterized protein OBRU01_10461 [Operophtera brumata]